MSGTALKLYVEGRGQKGIEITRTADLFRRYAFIEQSCVRALAGWFLKHPDWEVKIQLGYYLFAHAEHVHEHYGRLEELRGGNRNANIEPELNRIGEELVHAPDEQSFLSGFCLILKALKKIYQEHVDVMDTSANAMEIRILQRILPDVTQEIKEIENLLQTSNLQDTHQAQAWTCYLESLLKNAGGIGGMDPREGEVSSRPKAARFDWPAPIQFDERLQVSELGTYESKVSLPLRERSIGEFEVYFNEFYAAALLATVIYDSWKMNAPRQYFLDIAHHFWDEVRHAEFGAIRLRELGVEPSKVNMVLFEQSQHMPLLHRFCYLTLGLEIFFMPRKSERTRFYEAQGDARSQLFADVDWSEEINHVNYGKRWLAYFLEDDARTVKDIQEEITSYLETSQKQLPGDRQAPW